MTDRPRRRFAIAACLAASIAALLPAAAPPLPDLNQKVVEYLRSRVGQKVGNGECTTLADQALRAAGARRYPFDPSGDYVWGRPVDSFKDALPGDVLQFRDAVFRGRRSLPGNRTLTWRQDFPHHTAVVVGVSDKGRVVTLLHQNFGPSGSDDAAKRVVQEETIRPAALQKGGKVWIYRPVSPDDPGGDPPGPRPVPGKEGGPPCSGTP